MEYPIWIRFGGMALLYFGCALIIYMGAFVFRGYLETGSRMFERVCGSALMFIGTFAAAVITYEAFFSVSST